MCTSSLLCSSLFIGTVLCYRLGCHVNLMYFFVLMSMCAGLHVNLCMCIPHVCSVCMCVCCACVCVCVCVCVVHVCACSCVITHTLCPPCTHTHIYRHYLIELLAHCRYFSLCQSHVIISYKLCHALSVCWQSLFLPNDSNSVIFALLSQYGNVLFHCV